MVCCNLCISTDGYQDEMRVGNYQELQSKILELIQNYQAEKHLEEMFDEIGRDGLPERFSLDALVEPIIQKYISARRSDRTPRFNKMTGRMTRR